MTILGVGIAIVSYEDSLQIDVLSQVNQQTHQLGERLDQEYHIHTQCIGGGTAFGGSVCGRVVSGNYLYEEKTRKLKEFDEKLTDGRKKIHESIDQEVLKEATKRGFRDFAGLLFGSAVSLVGLVELLRNDKEKI